MLVTRETWRSRGQPSRVRSGHVQLRGSIFLGTLWAYLSCKCCHLSTSTTGSEIEAGVLSSPVSGLPSDWKKEIKKEQIGQISPIVLRVSVGGQEIQAHCKNNDIRKFGAYPAPMTEAWGCLCPADSCSTLMPPREERPQADPNRGGAVISVLGISTDFPRNLVHVKIHIYQLIFNSAYLEFITLFLTYSQVQSVLSWPRRK